MKISKTVISITVAVVIGFVWAVALCVQALYSPQAVAAVEAQMRVVLDAGHGGIDGGVTGRATGAKESDVNLAIVHCLKIELEDMGFEVILTRKTEAGLYGAATKGFKKRDMQRRKEIIEESNPDLVISVHQNFYPTKKTRGGQVFYKKNAKKSKALAVSLQDKINALYQEQGAKNRKIQTGDYFMLDCCVCPSVIVECGFLSNADDEKLLINEGWQKRLAQSLAAGVVAYFSDSFA